MKKNELMQFLKLKNHGFAFQMHNDTKRQYEKSSVHPSDFLVLKTALIRFSSCIFPKHSILF
jgi:hypothetical protein